VRPRLETAELALPALDALEVDSLAVFVGPERPLQGLAALVDWRLAGAVSRAILSGTFDPAAGEVLLLPSGGRLRAARVFLLGVDGTGEVGPAVVRRAHRVLDRAGARAVGVGLPGEVPSPAAVRTWVEGTAERPFARQVILGDARGLHAAVEAAVASLGVDVEVGRIPSRAPAAPHGR
jgi:hypothetical protein